jgi:hypothetical protein
VNACTGGGGGLAKTDSSILWIRHEDA